MNEIEAQIKELLDKAAEKPMPEDKMDMIGFGSTLLAVQMFIWECKRKQEVRERKEKQDG